MPSGKPGAAGHSELKQLTQKIDNIISAIADGMRTASMQSKLNVFETRKGELEAKLASFGNAHQPLRLHPGLADIYQQKITSLSASLSEDATRRVAADLLRGLITEIRPRPNASASGGHSIYIYGELGAILELVEGTNTKPTRVAWVLGKRR